MSYLSYIPAHLLSRPAADERRGRAVLESPDSRHRAVMSLFGQYEANARSTAGVLFRVENLPERAPAFLIRSKDAPIHLPDHPEVRTRKEGALGVAEGDRVRFRIAVNAVRRPSAGGPIRPVPLDLPVDQADVDDMFAEEAAEPAASHESPFTPWLAGKLHDGLGEVIVTNHLREVIGQRTRRGRGGARDPQGRTVQIDTADGVALVRDPARLAEQLAAGIGRARSYGCGLLTVARLR